MTAQSIPRQSTRRRRRQVTVELPAEVPVGTWARAVDGAGREHPLLLARVWQDTAGRWCGSGRLDGRAWTP